MEGEWEGDSRGQGGGEVGGERQRVACDKRLRAGVVQNYQ